MAEGDGEEQASSAHTGTSDAFISYASQDAALADAVVAALERQGLKCWIAPRDVAPGALYADEIIGAINGAKVLLLVLSKDAIASPHVGKEVERSASKRKPIITLRTDASQLTPALEYFLSEGHWVDLEREGSEAAFAKLAGAIRRKLVPACAGAAGAPPDQRLADIPAATQRKSWIVTAVLILAVGAIAFLYVERFGLNKRAERVESPTTAMPKPAPDAATFHPPPHSVAVLPFVNMSADAKQEYFSDGISEELLNSLTRLNGLQVAARTSSFSFKGQNVDVSTIARKLNVGAIVEGSVRRSNTKVRITVQLINSVTGFHIWSQTYDRQLSDILKVQTEVATSIAQQLKSTLDTDDVSRLELGGTKNPEAYDAYLLGMQRLANWDTNDSNDRAALTAFDRAIALDGGYAFAYVGRATALVDISIFDAKAAEIPGLREQALKAAERAVSLAPELGEAHWAIAGVYSNGLLDFSRAAPEFDRALALSPGSARVQRGYGGFAGQLGRFQPAIVAGQRAVALDPENVESYVALGQILTWARRYDEALATLHTAALLRPSSVWVRYNIANAMLASRQFESARQLCESDSIPKQGGGRKICLTLAYHGLGLQNEAEKQLEEFKVKEDAASVELAGLYAQLGEKRAALETLTKAEQRRSPDLQVFRVSWQLDPIRSEPEFKAIEARLNFPP